VEGDSVTDDNAGESAGEPPRLNMGLLTTWLPIFTAVGAYDACLSLLAAAHVT